MTEHPGKLIVGRAVLALMAAVSCSKGPTEPRVPTRLEIVSGANQSAMAGETLAGKIVVRASDGQGPLPGVAISSSVESPGGGLAAPRNLTTDASGQAETNWTLGSKLGTQTLTFTTTGVAPLNVTASATPGAPALVSAITDAFQYTVVSRAVTLVPRVKVTDLFGNEIAGATVTFEPGPGGSVTGATPTTGADGTAAVGSWTIGPDATTYVLNARIGAGAVATFQAQGVPATFTVAGGNGQTANVGTAVASAPAVRAGRDDGTPLPGVLVTFSVTGGGGIVQGSSVTTGIDGIARATKWILGPVAGPNGAEARAFGRDPVNYVATGVAGTATAAVATSPAAQTGFFGNFVGTSPTVAVKDALGNPVAGIPVTFQISGGDGQITGSAQVTDFDGQARLGSWRLGSAVSHAVQATSAGFPPVTFNATASAAPPSTFTIEVRFITDPPNQAPTPAQQAAFDQAVVRWKEILISGAPPYPVNETASSCYPAMNETVPGVVIFAKLASIDGTGGILGQAGPCIVRDDPMYQSAVGLMRFDVADLAGLETTGRLNAVILHEMGHVLGFGTLWNFLTNALLTGPGTSDPFFNGSSARGAFLASVPAGTTFTGNPVPVENSGGTGTRDYHWRDAIMKTELMTGFISAPGVANPLSAFTAAAFRDMGYVVNDAVTDQFTLDAFLQSALEGPGFQLREAAIREPILVINRRGVVVRRVERQ